MRSRRSHTHGPSGAVLALRRLSALPPHHAGSAVRRASTRTPPQDHEQRNQNLILAVILSAAVLFGWEYFVAKPQMEGSARRRPLSCRREKQCGRAAAAAGAAQAGTLSRDRRSARRPSHRDRYARGRWFAVLKGARSTICGCKHYRETTDPKSPEIMLLLARRARHFPITRFSAGWLRPAPASQFPTIKSSGRRSRWNDADTGHARDAELEQRQGAALHPHDLGRHALHVRGARSRRPIAAAARVTLYPYAYVVREGVPTATKFWALHEGFVGDRGRRVEGRRLRRLQGQTSRPQTFQSTGGWLGITDKYWMAAVIPPQDATFDGDLSRDAAGSADQGLSGRLPAGRADRRAGRHGRRSPASVRRRQGRRAAAVLSKTRTASSASIWRSTGAGSGSSPSRFSGRSISSRRYMNFGLAILLLTVLDQARCSSRWRMRPIAR